MIVKPTYKEFRELPGGVVEQTTLSADIAALVPKSIHIDLNDGEPTFTFELG